MTIPLSDLLDFEEEPVDELASAGMHVVGEADEDVIADEEDELSASAPIIPSNESEEDEITDGLKLLEELEKTMDEPPLEMGMDD
ncbi:hypothetical protein KBC54_02565 [Patescibacteria group bacterium]|nr:hypothetical protein [Patescibacteria group bacterium]